MIYKDSGGQIKEFNDLVVYSIGRLYTLLNQYLSGVYKEFNLNPAKFNLLMLIKHIGKEKGVSQIELGDRLCVSAANITKLIDGLEKKAWIKRVAFADDRRVKLIKITPQGSNLLDKVWLKHTQALNKLLKDFTREEKKRFSNDLDKFIKEMQEQ